jgi:hypothetical protein
MDAPVVPGCVIRARLVGTIEAKQKAKGEDWQRNDRLIAVATHAQTHQDVKSLEDLRPHLVDEIKEFFIEYNRLRGRKFKPLALSGPDKSRELIKSGMDGLRSRTIKPPSQRRHCLVQSGWAGQQVVVHGTDYLSRSSGCRISVEPVSISSAISS